MRPYLILLFVANAALADDAGLVRCRAIADSAARLACYDALVLPSSDPRAAPGSRPTPSARGEPGSPPSQARDQFGLEDRNREADLAAIDSRIAGRFEGWGPGTAFKLANGQVWKVADGSSGAHWIENPKVRVRRGLLGAFYLEIEGTNRSPRVTRQQ